MKIGVSQFNKPTPRAVTVLCNGVNSILVFAAGYHAFSSNAKTVFMLMVAGMVVDKIVKPLFGADDESKPEQQ